FDGEIAAEALGLRAGGVLAQLLGEVGNVLGQTDDRDATAAAGLLKEVVPFGNDEILEFVLPEEYRVRRFRELAPEPGPLKDHFQNDVAETPCLMAEFEDWKIADDDLPVVRGQF